MQFFNGDASRGAYPRRTPGRMIAQGNLGQNCWGLADAAIGTRPSDHHWLSVGRIQPNDRHRSALSHGSRSEVRNWRAFASSWGIHAQCSAEPTILIGRNIRLGSKGSSIRKFCRLPPPLQADPWRTMPTRKARRSVLRGARVGRLHLHPNFAGQGPVGVGWVGWTPTALWLRGTKRTAGAPRDHCEEGRQADVFPRGCGGRQRRGEGWCRMLQG
jgi:hypothetical protein